MEISSTRPASPIRIGDRVRVRRERWIVAGVEPHDGCTLVTLAAGDPAASTRTFHVLSPFDDVVKEARRDRPRRVGLPAWRRASRLLVAADGPAGTFRTAASARIDLLPYQLEPALALLRGYGCRLLIADEVGLGKTVQAALAVAELRASGAAYRVLIVCPAGLREQWVEETHTRFALDVALLDPAAIRRCRAALPPDINPWTLQACAVTSIDYVKRPEVLPLVLDVPWDVVVVDEAHGAAGPSDRHDAVAALCRTASYVLLLTATPHNGDDEAFAALCRTGALDEPLLVFRRSRAEAARATDRHVHIVRVRPSPPEAAMHAALRALTAAIEREGADRDPRTWLMLTLLHKRACSSPFALAESARRRLDGLEDRTGDASTQLLLPLDDAGEQDESDAAPVWTQPALRDGASERALLNALVEAARAAECADSKLRRLARLLRAVREPLIVFTEYRDTLLHVQRSIAPGAAIVHGGLTRAERRAALASFHRRGGVLLATDAAGEGLNLQQECRTVVNLELPWNPMRLEQRIGRVDRIGQRRRVHAFHLVSDGEARLLERLAARVARAGANIGAADPLGTPPPWTESAVADLVIGVSRSAPREQPFSSGAPLVPLVRYEQEAAAECQRLHTTRRLLSSHTSDVHRPGTADETAPLVARTARRRTRLATGGRALAIFRSDLCDAAGRVIASHLTSVLVPLTWCGHDAAEVVGGIGVAVAGSDRANWLAQSVERHARLMAMQRRRLDAIAVASAYGHEARQPGLFDRRTERSENETGRRRDERARAMEERRLRLDAAAALSADAPRLALLLLACRPTRR
jgi:superfamily II DNA or RNA helicase